jgi:hypothetical protein
MFWIYIGLLPALLAAAAVFFTASRLRPRSVQSRPAHPVLLALLAGALWPILALGLTEFAMVMVLPKAMRHRSHPRQWGIAADTTALAQR